jgi:hypothetical protein
LMDRRLSDLVDGTLRPTGPIPRPTLMPREDGLDDSEGEPDPRVWDDPSEGLEECC